MPLPQQMSEPQLLAIAQSEDIIRKRDWSYGNGGEDQRVWAAAFGCRPTPLPSPWRGEKALFPIHSVRGPALTVFEIRAQWSERTCRRG